MHKWCFMRDLTASGKSVHPSGDLSPEREQVRQACDKRQYEVYELVKKVVTWRGDFLKMIFILSRPARSLLYLSFILGKFLRRPSCNNIHIL